MEKRSVVPVIKDEGGCNDTKVALENFFVLVEQFLILTTVFVNKSIHMVKCHNTCYKLNYVPSNLIL